MKSIEFIDKVPEIRKYPHIYTAHKESKLIIFVGAGVSALWGCKRWKDMAISLIDDCYDNGDISYWHRKILLDKYQYNPRKLITIAQSILNDKYIEKLKLTICPSPERKEKYPKLFENLSALNAIFVTTNIDDHLSSLFDQKDVHVNAEDFDLSFLRPKNCFHLHGLISRNDSLVMTIDEYVKRYQNVNIASFLKHIFFDPSFRLLFMGYGIDELEIIDYMVEKYSYSMQKPKLLYKNYILMPTFRNEAEILKHESIYFNKLEMSVIPYAIDDIGYDQLYELIAIWKDELLAQDKNDEFYKFTQLIEKYK